MLFLPVPTLALPSVHFSAWFLRQISFMLKFMRTLSLLALGQKAKTVHHKRNIFNLSDLNLTLGLIGRPYAYRMQKIIKL